MFQFENYIYSNSHNSFLCTPMKTASTLVTWVLRYFDFKQYSRIFQEETYFDFINDNNILVHSDFIPPEFENYSVILTTRNPYKKTLSYFLHIWEPSKFIQPRPDDFINFLHKVENTQTPQYKFLNQGLNLNHDFLIKSESIYDDLCKIPFISNSDLKESGILKNMCSKNINPKKYKIDESLFLTPETKEIIYNVFKPHFEKYGYEK